MFLRVFAKQYATDNKEFDIGGTTSYTPPMKTKPDFTSWCATAGLPVPVSEYKFHPTRKWRFDYAWPELKIALEVEGGVWSGGRHTSGKGFTADMEKYNAAVASGWAVLRVVPTKLMVLSTVVMLRQVVDLRG